MRKSESLLLTSLETVDIVVWGRNVLSYMVLLRRSTMNLKKVFLAEKKDNTYFNIGLAIRPAVNYLDRQIGAITFPRLQARRNITIFLHLP